MVMKFAAAVVLTLVVLLPGAAESQEWWEKNRAVYSAFALRGAGGSLMKYRGVEIREKLKSFDDLPVLLDDARRLGCDCIYLVDYWEGGYSNKGDYVPRSDLGGPEAFARGVKAVREKGGRVILYLEAFIIHRESVIGRKHGPDWAMMNEGGKYLGYYGRDEYYLMFPGGGSGWTEHLCGLAEEMTRRYGVDGFHLDSYGLQWDLRDHNPKHPGASDPAKFNEGAIRLVKTLRERIRKVNPDAVVMLEGCERTELLEVCDGGQFDTFKWRDPPAGQLLGKPWAAERKHTAFMSHYSLEEMERILKSGHNVMLAPWWIRDLPDEEDFDRMRRAITWRHGWEERMKTLWYWDNLLYANGVPRPKDVDLFQLRRDLSGNKPEGAGTYDTPAYRAAVEAYIPLVKKLLSSGKPVKSQSDRLRELLRAARR